MKGNQKNKIEFSKKMFYIIITLFVIVIGFSMVLMWKTQTTDALAYLIPAISGLAATNVGFYLYKAKCENIIKISQQISLEQLQQTNQYIQEQSSVISDINSTINNMGSEDSQIM